MSRTCSRQLARLGALLAVALAAGIALPAGATASYTVHACDSAAGGANRSWSVQRDAPELHLTAFTKCYTLTPDPYGDMHQGIGIYDNFAGGDVPSDGRYAEQRFTAPAGTRITAAELTRDIGNRDVYWRPYGRINGVDQPTETCFAAAGEAFCQLQGPKVFSGLNAQTIAYGARCETPDPYCVNGSTLHMVWSLVRSASVTLDDTAAPTVSTPTATGLADGNWHRGAGTITFTADDNTGIRVRRLLEGATTRATATAPNAAAGGCGTVNSGDAYTYLQPCAGARGLNGAPAVTVADVCAWGDGEHAIRAAAEDTGGTSTSSAGTVTVRVDCTGPAVAMTPSSEQTVDDGQTITPSVSATDPRSVASTEIQWQTSAMNYWLPYTAPISAQAGFAYRFRARASDAVGNMSSWSQPSAWTHTRLLEADPLVEQTTADAEQDDAPQPPTRPRQTEHQQIVTAPVLPRLEAPTAKLTSARFSRRTRTLNIKGTAANAATVVITIKTNAKRPLTRRARVTDGRFSLTVRFSKRTRRARVVRIRASGLR